MATLSIEVKERQINHLKSLLNIKSETKKVHPDFVVPGLQHEISNAIAPMSKEDIAWVEKLTGVTAL